MTDVPTPLAPIASNPAPLPPARVSEHLANERTFLAWVRTGISLISVGIAINKFSLYLVDRQAKANPDIGLPSPGRLIGDSQTLGLILILFGLLSVGWAAWRFSQTTQRITEGTFQPSVRAVWVMTLGVLLFAGFCVYSLFQR